MRLKSIMLHGFKSFCNRTEVPLGQGITAIVGNRGSRLPDPRASLDEPERSTPAATVHPAAPRPQSMVDGSLAVTPYSKPAMSRVSPTESASPERSPDQCEPRSLRKDQPQDTGGRRTESHANSYLVRAQFGPVGHHAIDTGGGQASSAMIAKIPANVLSMTAKVRDICVVSRSDSHIEHRELTIDLMDRILQGCCHRRWDRQSS